MADTAIDTNVLLDLLFDDPDHRPASEQALDAAARQGRLLIGPATLAELATAFARFGGDLDGFLNEAGILVTSMRAEDCRAAGEAFARHLNRRRDVGCPECRQSLRCKGCGTAYRGRDRIATDFLVAAHARQAGRLLTRDKGLQMSGVRVHHP